ncbi:MAG TPA: hypothetical protein VMX55_05590 [candidate division Zixibacteria bacterium]|nr:hypothetical protein [candidate division Zixibacteria bacterium]
MSLPKVKRRMFLTFILVSIVLSGYFVLTTIGLDQYFIKLKSNIDSENQFPFVGQYMIYEVVQTAAGIPAASGKLTVSYDSMVDETTIHGIFHVEVVSLIEYYNETADGTENLENRHLVIHAEKTYLIDLFMVHFFKWTSLTPTPMWILPQDIKIGANVHFWNYNSTCFDSQSITLNENFYEVFIYRTQGEELNMTLMYSYARHGLGEWHGILTYMSANIIQPSFEGILQATFKLAETNAELLSLGELNRNSILYTAISFYSVVIIGSTIYRLKKRRDLIGGEI